MIIWEGNSLINGEPVVVIGLPGSNPKIGKMLCVHILCQNVAPEVAVFEGMDDTICGDCRFRVPIGTARKLHDTAKMINNSNPQSFAEQLADESLIKREGELFEEAKAERLCYVRLSSMNDDFGPKADEEMGPSEIWRAWKAGEFKNQNFREDWEAHIDMTVHKGMWWNYIGPLTVRIGSYGDPAAVPTRVWEELVKNARNFTGYTHQWRPKTCPECYGSGLAESETKHAANSLIEFIPRCENCNGSGQVDLCDPKLKKYCMASVDTEEEREEANRLGWRGFIVAPADVDVSLLGDDVLCPMTAGKNVTCDKCHMCQGTSSKVKQNIWEKAHGANLANHKW